MPSQNDIWNQIDHTLVSLKLQQARPQLDRESERKRRKVYARHRGNLNAASIPASLLDVEIEQMGKWAATLYQIYCDAWKAQGRKKTPQFLREIYHRAIVPTVEVRKGDAAEFFTNRAARTKQTTGLSELLAELERAADRVKDDWRQKTEIEAIEVEHKQSGLQRVKRRAKGKPRAKKAARQTQPPTPSERRAKTVARIIKELNTLKPQMYSEADYRTLQQGHPGFLAFKIAAQRPDLRVKLVNIQDHQRHIRLAQELTAHYHGVEWSTMQTDWKKNKPKAFRARRMG